MSRSGTAPRARYERVCALGQGGMGTVELALLREGAFHRLVALKRPHPALLLEPATRAMFLSEAHVAGLLRHPHVVGVVDVCEDDVGPFLVMEYVEGVPVSRLLAEAAHEALPLRVCLSVVAQAARGLHAAHELVTPAGDPVPLIHRDVSPQNVIAGYDGLVRVSDFGVAKAVGGSGETVTGLLKGNPGYMAPEVLRFAEIDRRADLFSLGVVLHELLTGRRLYPAREGTGAARRILDEPPPDPIEARPDLPAEVVELVLQLLAKAPADRPATAEEVAVRLEHLLGDLGLDDHEPDLRTYLEARFGEDRRRLAAQVADAVQALRAAPAAPTSQRLARRGLVGAVALVSMVAASAAALVSRRRPPAAVGAQGLLGSYFTGTELRDLRMRRVDHTIDFSWGDFQPHEALPADEFSVRWTGWLVAPIQVPGPTLVCVASDDGARLRIDGAIVVSDWAVRPPARNCAKVQLRPGGRHALELEYFEKGGGAMVRLLWEDPSAPGQVIPIPAAHLVPPDAKPR